MVLLMVLVEFRGSLRSFRTVWWVLKSSFGPGALEKPEGQEAVFTESPTGIAYGTSVLFLPSIPSDLDDLNLMGCLMGPKSFLEGL